AAEVEGRQREILQSLPDDETAIVSMWKRLAEPELWPFERLFFECYARGAQGESPFDRLLPALVEDWLQMFPRGRTRDQARLVLPGLRRLLLPLLATPD